jgi:hypothetical protein
MIYKLETPEQAHALMQTLWPKIKEALQAGKQFDLEIKPVSKTREQEKKYHSMIGDIAKQAQHLGSKWDAESWKRLLVDAYCKETQIKTGMVIPNLAGDGIIQLGFQTRKFTKEQATDFVEWLAVWGAENGIEYAEKM